MTTYVLRNFLPPIPHSMSESCFQANSEISLCESRQKLGVVGDEGVQFQRPLLQTSGVHYLHKCTFKVSHVILLCVICLFVI